jgi:creatinine amidohydrolase/Fe(II)-dependent formamide hydrolase-like protein
MIARVVRHLLAILLLAAAQALAQAPQTVFLDELTSSELRDQVRAGRRTIIVPIGGTEQNGPHMVLGKHNVRVKVLAEKIALALGDALVAPVMAYVPEGGISPPTSHMRFPGTISIPDQTFQQILEYSARSLKLHGFRDIVFLGDHGGYQKDEQAVADRLNREWASAPTRVHALPEYYRAAAIVYADALRQRGYPNDEIGAHAGLADTSLALAIDPRLVRRELLRSARTPGVDRTSEGVSGDPRRASAELGQIGVDAIVAQTVDAIKRATARR